MEDQISITDAAFRLAMTYQQVRDLLLGGHLKGGKNESGRFYVDVADLERLAKRRAAKRRSHAS